MGRDGRSSPGRDTQEEEEEGRGTLARGSADTAVGVDDDDARDEEEVCASSDNRALQDPRAGPSSWRERRIPSTLCAWRGVEAAGVSARLCAVAAMDVAGLGRLHQPRHAVSVGDAEQTCP